MQIQTGVDVHGAVCARHLYVQVAPNGCGLEAFGKGLKRGVCIIHQHAARGMQIEQEYSRGGARGVLACAP